MITREVIHAWANTHGEGNVSENLKWLLHNARVQDWIDLKPSELREYLSDLESAGVRGIETMTDDELLTELSEISGCNDRPEDCANWTEDDEEMVLKTMQDLLNYANIG